MEECRRRHKEQEELLWGKDGWRTGFDKQDLEDIKPSFSDIHLAYVHAEQITPDPTRLIIIDEADRLKISALEQLRDIFDHSRIGVILIGMPGIEKRLARYAQLYSRVGFVHEFRPLNVAESRRILTENLCLPGGSRPVTGIEDKECLAAIHRITGGNFRLIDRLLNQIARVLEINNLESVTVPVIEAARESLVIGTE